MSCVHQTGKAKTYHHFGEDDGGAERAAEVKGKQASYSCAPHLNLLRSQLSELGRPRCLVVVNPSRAQSRDSQSGKTHQQQDKVLFVESECVHDGQHDQSHSCNYAGHNGQDRGIFPVPEVIDSIHAVVWTTSQLTWAKYSEAQKLSARFIKDPTLLFSERFTGRPVG